MVGGLHRRAESKPIFIIINAEEPTDEPTDPRDALPSPFTIVLPAASRRPGAPALDLGAGPGPRGFVRDGAAGEPLPRHALRRAELLQPARRSGGAEDLPGRHPAAPG